MHSTHATPGQSSHLSEGLWDRSAASLRAQEVQPTAVQWSVIRAEHSLQAVAHQRLTEPTPQDGTDSLEKLGRRGSLAAWPYGQTVDALQHVCLLGEVAWAPHGDWASWKVSARTLPVTHPTMAREAATVTRRATTPQKQTDRVSLARGRGTPAPALDALRAERRRRGSSIRTERTEESWVTRSLAFMGHADPWSLGPAEVMAWLEHRAVERQVTASTHNQARKAWVFFSQHIVPQPLGDLDGLVRAKRPPRLPVVCTRAESGKRLAHRPGTHGRMASVLDGTGMRLMDCIRLRVKDIDFVYNQIVVRDGKGQQDRVVPLPQRLVEPL